jgi:hypothetical protein
MEEIFRKSGQIFYPITCFFKNPVPTSQNTHCVPVMKTSRLMLLVFRGMIVYSENRMKLHGEMQCINAGVSGPTACCVF